MKPKLLLRLAAIIMFLHLIGHTIGALTWKQAPNAAVGKVIAGMQTEHFDFMGRSVTLAKFFDGYGFNNIFVLSLIIMLLWILSGEPNKKLLWPILIFLGIQACIEWYFFFPLPSIMSYAAAICCALAIRKINLENA